ncbi:unnamed protein product, partial [Amoebophrya sp. A25]
QQQGPDDYEPHEDAHVSSMEQQQGRQEVSTFSSQAGLQRAEQGNCSPDSATNVAALTPSFSAHSSEDRHSKSYTTEEGARAGEECFPS